MAKCTVRPAGGNYHIPDGILGSLLDQLDVENSGKARKRNPLFQDEGSWGWRLMRWGRHLRKVWTPSILFLWPVVRVLVQPSNQLLLGWKRAPGPCSLTHQFPPTAGRVWLSTLFDLWDLCSLWLQPWFQITQLCDAPTPQGCAGQHHSTPERKHTPTSPALLHFPLLPGSAWGPESLGGWWAIILIEGGTWAPECKRQWIAKWLKHKITQN